MPPFRIVPDSLRERAPVRKGRKPTSDSSKFLLAGRTINVPKGTNTGSFYTLAKNHGMICKTRLTVLNDVAEITVWFVSEE